jgi:ribosomal protein S18 acetylase RimI-like enzyme
VPISQSVGFTIRAARDSDAPHIERCLYHAFDPYRNAYTPGGFDDTVPSLAAIRERIAKMLVLVAVGDDAVIGTLAAVIETQSQHAHLRGMAVEPNWQGRGVASALLHAMEHELRAREARRVTLGVTAPLSRAQQLYEANGFQRTGRVNSYFGMALYEYEKSLEDAGN